MELKNGTLCGSRSITREIIRDYEFYYRNERGQRLAGIHKFNVFITTYEILLSDLYELREIEWRAIVIDEAHRLKNKNCKLLEGLKLLDVVSGWWLAQPGVSTLFRSFSPTDLVGEGKMSENGGY